MSVNYGATMRKKIKKMAVSQSSKYGCEFCGKVYIAAVYLLNSIYYFSLEVEVLKSFVFVAVFCEEAGCWNLGMQGMWQS